MDFLGKLFLFYLICLSDSQIYLHLYTKIVYPLLNLNKILEKAKLTKKDNQEFGRWHFIVDKTEKGYFLRTEKGNENTDITHYFNNFDVLK